MSRSRAAYRAADTRREREEAVTVNLPPDLLPLWDKVKASFSGAPDARREAFLQYAHEHGKEAIEALDAASAIRVAAIVKTQPAPQPETGPSVYAIGTRKGGWQIRTDAPRYYAEDGTTYAYWRGAGAFPIKRGALADADGARVRTLPSEVASEVVRLEVAIRELETARRALLERECELAPLVRVGDVPF